MKTRQIVAFFMAVLLLSLQVAYAREDVAARISELSAIKATDIHAYDAKVPTGGTRKTAEEYNALLSRYPYKDATKGSSVFSYCLTITKSDYSENPGTNRAITDVTKRKIWVCLGDNGTYANYTEELCLQNEYNTDIGKTKCYLMTEDKTNTYYSWTKGEKIGTLRYEQKTPTATSEPESSTSLEYMFYRDETVLGELCKVYSVREIGNNDMSGDSAGSSTGYYWLSTVSGKILRYMYISDTGDSYYESATTYFVDYRLNKPDDFYVPPADVVFSEK